MPTSKKRKNESGATLIEVLVVMAIIVIIALYAVLGLGSEKLYEADTQAQRLIDVFQEARQRSLSQRTTMRVEINLTDRVINIIDEGRNALDSSDDTVIKADMFVGNGNVFIGTTADNQDGSPVELSPVPAIAFSPSVHPLSAGDNVATLRFLRNGIVTNAGDDAIGTGSVPTGATIFVWSNTPENPTEGQVFRAVTVLSISGLTRLWKCGLEDGECATWQRS